MAALEKHHDIALKAKLDDLFLTGYCFLSWNELYHWFNITKIAKAPWREIAEQWNDLCERRDIPPPAIRARGFNNINGGARLFRDRIESIDGDEHDMDTLAS